MTKAEAMQVKQIIIEELARQRQELCKPHEERIEEMEKQMVQVFCNGLKSAVERTERAVEKLKSQRWTVPLAIVLSILTTYLIDKFL